MYPLSYLEARRVEYPADTIPSSTAAVDTAAPAPPASFDRSPRRRRCRAFLLLSPRGIPRFSTNNNHVATRPLGVVQGREGRRKRPKAAGKDVLARTK